MRDNITYLDDNLINILGCQ